MAAELIRIFSDIHYGDRASRVHRLAQLRPLLEGVARLVLNGDTLDTRPGPRPEHTDARRAEVQELAAATAATLLTGNHDADLSPHHTLELAGGRVFVTHGDILFDEIVPWGRDAPVIRREIAAALRLLPPPERESLEVRLAIWRRVAAAIPQRHQSEPNRWKYALRFATDTVWPPLRIFRILDVWRTEPGRAVAFARRHRPRAEFILLGHTHRPGVWHTPGGVTVINTGSFCRPLGGCAVDLTPSRLVVRRIVARNGAFHPGPAMAEFALADTPASARLTP